MRKAIDWLRRSARGAFPPSVAKGYGGYFGSGLGSLGTGEQQSFNRDAGLRYDSSPVYAAIMYAYRELAGVEIVHERPRRNGSWEVVKGSPIVDLLTNPNPWYGFDTLLTGWLTSEMASPTGMSYTYKHRGSYGLVSALEYVPHFSVTPFIEPGRDKPWVSFYQISLNGGYEQALPEDLLVQRYGIIDPLKPQQCFGPLESCLTNVVSDKEAGAYVAALLANMGATPHVFMPPSKTADDGDAYLTDENARDIKASWRASTRKGNRGEPMVFLLPLEIKDLCIDPSKMDLASITNINEERIGAALGIDPRVLNLGTGLEQGNNRASAEAAFKQAARSFVKPYMNRKGRELTRDLVPELGRPGDRIRFKTEDIEALQDDKAETAKRDDLELNYKTIDEKRAEKGLPPLPNGEGEVCLGLLKAKKGGDATKEKEEDGPGTRDRDTD